MNLETDVLGKYARRASEMGGEEASDGGGGLTFETLAENGFA